jgi:pimeloyl-ACP methyl ester carboxylesterase
MAPRLYYVHGSGYTQDSFRAQVSAFPGSVALSLPGHPDGEPLESVGAMADWLAAIVAKDGGKAVVAGNSLGGAIAMEWALRHPEQAAGIILIGTGAKLRVSQSIFDLIDNEWPSCIETLTDFGLSESASQQLRHDMLQWHRLVGQRATRVDYTACHPFDVMNRLAEIRVPTLIIVGGEDRLTPPKYAEYLHERIAGSELLVVPGAGHLVMAERPDVVNPAIAALLARAGLSA